jgi:cathepsin F
MKSFVGAALLGAATASQGGKLKLTWTDCGDASTHGHIKSLSPQELTIGDKTSLVGKGSLDEAMDGVSYKVTAKAGIVPVFSHTGDACKPEAIKLPAGLGEIDMKGFKCPIVPGAADLDLDVTLSGNVPAKLARVTIELTATAKSGDKALCMQIKTSPEAHDYAAMWEEFKRAYNKTYNPYSNGDDEEKRFQIFKANVAAAEARDEMEPLATFGLDQFSDLTEDEFLGYMGYVPEPQAEEQSISEMTATDFLGLTTPTSIDWTGKATTPVKNQGHCGSCWAFSATEQIESDYMLQKHSQVLLAPQELVDCRADKSERDGCKGGSTEGAYTVIEALGGMEMETDYPYEHVNQKCNFQSSKAKVQISSFQRVGKGDETAMKSYVGSTGPLSVCGHAKSWKGYKGGILSQCVTGGGHCFQIVGYGVDGGIDYWKVRNSWGSHWGEEGHIRIRMGENMCNIANNPTKVIIKTSEDSVVV